MGSLISNLVIACLGYFYDAEDFLKPLFQEGHYLRNLSGHEFDRAVRTAFRVGDLQLRLPTGSVEAWLVGLNTALCIGNDALKLFARLHGQCEVHCWFEGRDDKDWLTGVIQHGLMAGLMRQD